jgi:NADH dehydrogenase
LNDGHIVRALVRRRGLLRTAEAPTGRLEEVQDDINSENLTKRLARCDAVINLVGIIYERGADTFERVHNQGTRNLVVAARENGVKSFVQMSALGARPANASAYYTTKFAGEEEVRNSEIPYVVLRPSLIVGHGSAFLKQMAEVMRAAPLFRPVPGTGRYRFRPVHVDDVVECFAQSLTNPAAAGQTVDLVGGEELTFDEMAEALAVSLGIHKTAIHVPMPLMKAAAALFSLLPMQPPVTSVQLQMLEEGSTADSDAMKRIFRVDAVGFRTALRQVVPLAHSQRS